MALATLSEVKALLGLSGSADDARLTALIDGASAAIERFTGALFTPTPIADERHEGSGQAVILRYYPVISVEALTDGWSGEAMTGWRLDASAGMIFAGDRGERWPCGARRVAAAYTAGYAAVPADIKQALAAMVADGMAGGGAGFASESDGDYSYSRGATSFPPSALAILGRYRRAL